MPGVEVMIVAPKTTDRVETGEVGELLVSGPNVSAGYWERPEATAEAYLQIDGRRWFRSGDSMRFDPETQVYVVMGRLKELIISGGFNVYPLEVEEALAGFPGVREVAVIGRPSEQWGEAVTAIVVARGGEQLDVDELRAHCAGVLASYKVPKQIVYATEPLPRTRSGKLLRRELR